jgi:rare lipoprotein A
MKILINTIFFSFFLVLSASAQQSDTPVDTLQKSTFKKDSLVLDSLKTDSLLIDSLFSKNVRTVRGKASFYASKFHGRRTTNGEIFSNNKMTAAHLKLPFGTMVKVTNLSNGRTVVVRVNDRGPHSKVLIIDLSQAAAKKLGFFSKGVTNVEITYKIPGS